MAGEHLFYALQFMDFFEVSCQVATLSEPFFAFFALIGPRSCMFAEVVLQIPTLFEGEPAARHATLIEFVHTLVRLVDQVNCSVPIWWDSLESFRAFLHNKVVAFVRCQLLTNFVKKLFCEFLVVNLFILRLSKGWVQGRILIKLIHIISLVSQGLNLACCRLGNPLDLV